MVKKILIVDDEKDIALSIKSVVDKMGYESRVVYDGKTALQTLKQDKFDLVLLDILMPGMSGRQVLEEIRKDKKLKNQKAAFVSVVYLGQMGVAELNKLKPADYFQKPIVDLNDFRKRLKRILD